MKFLLLSVFFTVVSCTQSLEERVESAHTGHDSTVGSWRRFNSSELEIFLKGIPKSLVFLGKSRDGKVVFVDNTSSTWQEARSKCESLNLSLLQILSQDQLNFVISADNLDLGEYWIGGRENRKSAESITWDKIEYTPPKFMTAWSFYGEDNPYQLCLRIRRSDDYKNGWMAARACTFKFWYLCEA